MKITILTLFPEMFKGFLETSIIKKALLQDKVVIDLVNIRDFANNKWNRVDAPPVGGGAGLVMQVEPLVSALESLEAGHKVLLSPRGQVFKQLKAHHYSMKKHLILICGHYEGIDERVNRFIDEELSIGDFVMTGGEIAAMAVSDAVIRLLQGVINEESLLEETFSRNLLEYPQYAEPYNFRNLTVPEILYSGNHSAIKKWRLKQSLHLTYLKRPDLYAKLINDNETDALIDEALKGVTGDWEKKAIESARKFTSRKDNK